MARPNTNWQEMVNLTLYSDEKQMWTDLYENSSWGVRRISLYFWERYQYMIHWGTILKRLRYLGFAIKSRGGPNYHGGRK